MSGTTSHQINRPRRRFCRNPLGGYSVSGFVFRIRHRRMRSQGFVRALLISPSRHGRHGDKAKNSRQKPGGKSPGTGRRAMKKAKNRKTRPQSILLADLFLWISVVDECLYHPTGALDRAAKTEGYGSVGNVVQRLDVLEGRFGKLFYRNSPSDPRRADSLGGGRRLGARLRSRAKGARTDAQEPAQRPLPRHARLQPGEGQYRSGVPTFRGAALAELFVVIELLYSRASSLEISGFLDELRKLKGLILHLAPRSARRAPDDADQNRIRAALEWGSRRTKTGRRHDRKKMSDWPTFGVSPVKPRAWISPPLRGRTVARREHRELNLLPPRSSSTSWQSRSTRGSPPRR
jgi:hypothetical protein